MSKIRVAIADDHAIVRIGTRTILSRDSDIKVMFEAADGEALIEGLKEQAVDAIVCDIHMPKLDGVEVVKRLRSGANMTPVVLLTDGGQYLQPSLRAGANAYLLKDVEPALLIDVVRKVVQGKKVFLPATNALRNNTHEHGVHANVKQLNEREKSIIRLMAAGLANREIADCLSLSEGTVKNKVSSILSKMSVRDRTQAVLRGINQGVI